MGTVQVKSDVENLHLQAFNRTLKDLLDLKELYLTTRLSGERYSNDDFDAAFRSQQIEVRQATLALLWALGLKHEYYALQRGLVLEPPHPAHPLPAPTEDDHVSTD